MAARFALVAIANAAIASAQFLDDDYTTTRYTSAYWTYTYAQAEVATQSLYTYYDDTVATETYTEYRTIKDGVTPTIAPYSTSTALGYYDDLEVVYAYYTTSAVAESDLVPESRVITWIIIIACIIPGLFLLGFLESWFWFRRLMLGKSAMRFDRRSAEDQKMLAERWKNMGSGAAFKAWWKWGFRHRYPEELLGQFSKTTVGFVPPGQPLYPAMAQTPGASQPMVPGQVYYYGPPPPGWVVSPNGGFVPPQGYTYPPPQQAGYYGDMTKAGPVVSQSSVSAVGYPQPQQQMGNVSPMAPQVPQAAHTAPQNGSHTPTPYGAPPNVGTMPEQAPPRSPSPEGPSPPLPPRPVAKGAPQIPPVNVGDATTTDDAAKQEPAAPATAPPPPKNDPNDRSLYE
ncbi:uncharacterized protein J4E92_003152 [Alternaria infectoria]|uniref:uncharacterized protein n=1 Tax=Alternaria infectoria TaxID=45303 RepID=UPI002220400D|nr:uncharacterized protein J4E92_003152 [Alternaria infectoria]KAI4933485.1 hypothetical protein J4E92_003152 [Alternaria infectoria]